MSCTDDVTDKGRCDEALRSLPYCEKWKNVLLARDRVSASKLYDQLLAVGERINDHADALGEIMNEQCTLRDGIVTCSALHPEVGEHCLTGARQPITWTPDPETPASTELGTYWSVHKDPSYDGPCMRVRRTDGEELDIGFEGSWLDTALIKAFSGGTQCYVAKWYTQSDDPAAQDVLQTNAVRQPTITNVSGVPYVDRNGRPHIRFNENGSYTMLETANNIAVHDYTQFLAVLTPGIAITYKNRLFGSTTGTWWVNLALDDQLGLVTFRTSASSDFDDVCYEGYLLCMAGRIQGADPFTLYRNGEAIVNSTWPSSQDLTWTGAKLRIGNAGSGGGSDAFNGFLSELYFAPASQADDEFSQEFCRERTAIFGLEVI